MSKIVKVNDYPHGRGRQPHTAWTQIADQACELPAGQGLMVNPREYGYRDAHRMSSTLRVWLLRNRQENYSIHTVKDDDGKTSLLVYLRED